MPLDSRHLATLICVAAVGCASTATPPAQIPANHLSAQGERAAARDDGRAAGVLERQAALESNQVACGPVGAGKSQVICWTAPEGSGDAAEDHMEAAELRGAAARHRTISGELREAAARACAGVAESDVLQSPFDHRSDIVGVEVVHGAANPAGAPAVLGARVRFHHVGGLTAEGLQHIVDCRIARDAALGNDVPDASEDPLIPSGAKAKVIEIPHGYIVDVRSDDSAAAREIARRALALTAWDGPWRGTDLP